MSTFPQNSLQPEVSSFFKTALEAQSTSHAYLFVGSHSEARLEMAKDLAAALVESDRSLIEAGTHPDVRVYKPASAVGYLSEQITEIINDVQLSPSRAHRKVFIVQDAQSLTDKTANALLKTLEEPPEDVTFLLLAQSETTVLPTIVSRSQLIRFRHEDEKELVSALMQKMNDATEAQILSALHVASSPRGAEAYLRNASARRAQALLLETIAELPTFTTWQLLQKAQKVLGALEANNTEKNTYASTQHAKGNNRSQDEDACGAGCAESAQNAEQQATLDAARAAEQQAAIEKEFLSAKALKEIEKAQKRAQKAASSEALEQLLHAAELFFRDIVALEAGVAETTLALPDTLETARRACTNWNSVQALHGIEIVEAARNEVRHNVAARLAFEAMLCHMEDELCQK